MNSETPVTLGMQSATLQESEIRAMVADALGVDSSSGILFGNGPTLSQCCGTSRLWGTDLAIAFHNDCDYSAPPLKDLQAIIAFGRAFLVLSDYSVDNSRTEQPCSHVISALNRLATRITSIIQTMEFFITPLNHDLENFQDHLLNIAKHDRLDIPKSIKLRGAMWSKYFFPYNAPSPYISEERRLSRLDFLRNYFELCLVLDDYCDIELDHLNSHWDNVFLAGRNQEEVALLVDRKSMIAISMLDHVSSVLLGEYNNQTFDNLIFRYYILKGQQWVDGFEFPPSVRIGAPQLIAGDQINDDVYSYLINNRRIAISTELMEISKNLRPEYLQTDRIPAWELS